MSLNIEEFEHDEIVSIEPMGILPTVDITVEDTHMFFLENGVYTHNSGLNAEVITMEAISEAFNKCFVSDFIFTVSRTVDDKVANSGRVFVAKNRNGPDGLVFPIFMDTSTVSIKVLQPSEEDENVEVDAKKQKQSLVEKYKNFKKNKGEN